MNRHVQVEIGNADLGERFAEIDPRGIQDDIDWLQSKTRGKLVRPIGKRKINGSEARFDTFFCEPSGGFFEFRFPSRCQGDRCALQSQCTRNCKPNT